MPEKIAILYPNLGPYHVARIQALRAKFNDVVAIELASRVSARHWERPKDMELQYITLVDGKYEEIPPKTFVRRVKETLEKIQPGCVIISGYGHPAMRSAARWAYNRGGTASILISESQECDRHRNPLREYIKESWIGKYFDAAFVSGASAQAYLESLGFASDRIWRGYSVVDNKYFKTQADATRSGADRIRVKLGLPARYFLYVGRFSTEKNLVRLLNAYKRYRNGAGEKGWDLVLLGSGPQEIELKTVVTEWHLKGVHWPGFKQIKEQPQYYALASAFILPSTREPWGLVVNEAMASGLPVAVSTRCGCALDLVHPGINGWVFDPFSEKNITESLARLSSKKTDRVAMGDASKSIVANYTLKTWAEALSDCISFAMSEYR